MKKKAKFQINSILAIIFIIASIYLMQSILLFKYIETGIRYLIVGIVLIIDIILLLRLFFAKKKKKKKYVKIIISVVLVLFSSLFFYVGFNLNKIYSYFSDLNTANTLVTLKGKNSGVNLSTLKNAKIGVNIEEEHKLADDIIKKYSLDKADKNNTMVDYVDYRRMILDLYDEKLDFIFLQTNFVDIYSTDENFEDIGEKIDVVDTTQKVVTKEEVQLNGSSKDISQPFTVLLMGIDSTVDGLQNADSFNGDSLIVVTFNPTTMHATMLSIPRDSYVPVTCRNNADNKITHAASGGARCVINTVQNFLGVKIDYYMKINFTGVVDLVNAVGGIEIDVPYKICEQNSKREFGNKMVYINDGHQLLNGEQALAYARNRKSNANYCSKEWTTGTRDDFVRAAHQQEVIESILDKAKNFSSVSDLEKILKVISKNFDTNMSEATIFSFYNIGKDVLLSSSSDSVITVEKLYLDGTGQMIFDERSGLVLWNYILNQKSLSAVKNAMKDNLSGKKHELIKSFSYKMDENYSIKVVGKGYYGTQKYTLLPNMKGWTLSKAQTWLKDQGIEIEVQYSESNEPDNTVIEQQYPESKRVDLIPDKKIILKVSRKGGSANANKVDCLLDETNEKCILQNFVGKSKDDFIAWANGFSNSLDVELKRNTESTEAKGTILSQSVEAGKTVKELLDNPETKLIIEYVDDKPSNNEQNGNEDPNQNQNPNNGETPSEGENNNNQNNEGGNNNQETPSGDQNQPQEPTPPEGNEQQ